MPASIGFTNEHQEYAAGIDFGKGKGRTLLFSQEDREGMIKIPG
jgi:hypothetical protein